MNQDPLAGFPHAAAWSLSTGQAGRWFVCAGILFFAIATVLWILPKQSKTTTRSAIVFYSLGSVSLFATMACLMSLFAHDQFQYQYVFEHGDVHTDLKYKIAGVWSGQQGSFLLWACTSALFGLLAFPGAGLYRRWFGVTFAAFLSTICAILAYETPFTIIPEAIRNGIAYVPPTGQGLTPALQNYWVVIHPPTIFMGFGSLTVLFAYSVAAIVTGNLNEWIYRVRPWALVSLAILGLGLCMGGLWAYETLGWGGFWKWDPVENTSFVPWVFVAAFVHGIIVQVSKGRWHSSNLWLGALPFLLFVYGTFLTRSGYLNEVSVHSFAEMNKSALWILLAFFVVSTAGYGVLYAVRGHKLAKLADVAVPNGDQPGGISREGLYSFGMLLLTLLSGMIAIGMSWPLFMALTGHTTSVVDESLYHRVVIWFFAPVMVLMACGPFVTWRTLPWKQFLIRVMNVFSISAGLTGFALMGMNNPKWGIPVQAGSRIDMPFGMTAPLVPWMGFLLFLCMFVAVSSIWRAVEMVRRTRTGIGGFIAHFGLAVLLTGLILSRGMEQKERVLLRPGVPEKALDYTITYEGMTSTLEDRNNKALFKVVGSDGQSFEARPGLYYVPGKDAGQQDAMLWPHVEHGLSHDVYFTLFEPQVYAWKDPVNFHIGDTKTVEGVTVTYLKPTMYGQPGQMGTQFGALLKVTVDGQSYTVEPKFVVGQGPTMPQFTPDLRMVMPSMNAADRSVDLQLLFSTPIYPVDLFYKPLTSLVWLGCGILTFGGLLTAFSRRRRAKRTALAEDEEETSTAEPAHKPRDERLPSPA